MRTVVVTGDSRGLGAEVVETLLADDEYAVVGVSRRETDAVDAARERWPDRYDHVSFDLAEAAAVEDLYREELEPRGPLYGLVNNAAWGYFDPLSETSAADLGRLLDVNVRSPMLLSKAVLGDMARHGTEGALVHVSSIVTEGGYARQTGYGATKGAIEAFSRSLAREWGDRGVRSNCVAPGFMETDMTAEVGPDARAAISGASALGEPTDPASVAETIAFLLSPAAASITGEVVRVDAGAR